MTEQAVLFDEMSTKNGYRIGIATLNAPNSLNALNHEMIHLLSQKLSQWEFSAEIVCVYLQAAGEKAFCAGGDIREVYNSLVSSTEGSIAGAKQFIEDEYNLDYQIFSYSKPIISAGDGIIMGGGLGLAAACNHRIVTEKSRLAMPEIKIGIYPDVGATYFLGRLPENIGLYIGLTSCWLNANDALHINIADYAIDHTKLSKLISIMAILDWGNDPCQNDRLITNCLTELQTSNTAQFQESNLIKHNEYITTVSSADNFDEIYRGVSEGINSTDNWIINNSQNLQYGSPNSAYVIYKQMQIGEKLDRKQVRDFEIKLTQDCFVRADFVEGVRALLMDKDLKPNWSPQTIQGISRHRIDDFFKNSSRAVQ